MSVRDPEWDPPEVEHEHVDWPDFWIESEDVGSGGTAFTWMNGRLLGGVQKVQASVDASDVTRVTITFLARSLNKGQRPRERR